RKLGRATEHRIAMLRNRAERLIQFEHIETTVPKAKELRPFVQRIISIAKRGRAEGGSDGATLHARRLVLPDIQNRHGGRKLFVPTAPRSATRPAGYTGSLRWGYRRGDRAGVAQIALGGSECNPNAEAERKAAAEQQPKAKGVGGRLRAAAERLRGKAKAEGEEGEGAEAAAPTKKAKPTHRHEHGPKADTPGKAAKTTTPRKAGGS